MKHASPPRWLVADWFVWLLLMLRFSLLHRVFLMCAERAVKRRMAPGDLELMAPLLAETEACLAWVIARRVRKLCGLSGHVEHFVQRLPDNQGAFVRRYRQSISTASRSTAGLHGGWRGRCAWLAPYPPSGYFPRNAAEDGNYRRLSSPAKRGFGCDSIHGIATQSRDGGGKPRSPPSHPAPRLFLKRQNSRPDPPRGPACEGAGVCA